MLRQHIERIKKVKFDEKGFLPNSKNKVSVEVAEQLVNEVLDIQDISPNPESNDYITVILAVMDGRVEIADKHFLQKWKDGKTFTYRYFAGEVTEILDKYLVGFGDDRRFNFNEHNHALWEWFVEKPYELIQNCSSQKDYNIAISLINLSS